MSANTALDHFLAGLQLTEYADMLKKQNVDLDALECMDADDFEHFDVNDEDHIEAILAGIADREYCELCRAKAARNEPPQPRMAILILPRMAILPARR